MLLYEIVIAIGIAVVLVTAAIGGLAARIVMARDPEESWPRIPNARGTAARPANTLTRCFDLR